MIKILLAEDDESLRNLVKLYLEQSGYGVTDFENGAHAYDSFLTEHYDIIITDIMMPNLDGFQFSKKIRELNQDIPILFMTAKDDKVSKQYGYAIGVDDYMVKPFDIDELVLKVGAILRRAKISSQNELVVGNLRLDQDEHTAYVDGQELSLTVREFDLLQKLLSFPKKTFTRSQLMEEFWDYDTSATSRTVDVYMAKLRDKTEVCDGFSIVTVHGLGYKVVLNNEKS